jgi:Arc/MetJ-type ribon-helix-helix transcriptional regulator
MILFLVVAYLINQIHVRIDEDKEIIKRIDELMFNFPGRWRTQSDVIRSAINFMHRKTMEEDINDRNKESLRLNGF